MSPSPKETFKTFINNLAVPGLLTLVHLSFIVQHVTSFTFNNVPHFNDNFRNDSCFLLNPVKNYGTFYWLKSHKLCCV